MIYYLDSRGLTIQEYLSYNGEYIGMTEKNQTLKSLAITDERISNRQKNYGEFLVCCILNSTWWVAFVYNTDEAKEILKEKYTGNTILWYWLKKDKVISNMPRMQSKEFMLEFK